MFLDSRQDPAAVFRKRLLLGEPSDADQLVGHERADKQEKVGMSTRSPDQKQNETRAYILSPGMMSLTSLSSSALSASFTDASDRDRRERQGQSRRRGEGTTVQPRLTVGKIVERVLKELGQPDEDQIKRPTVSHEPG